MKKLPFLLCLYILLSASMSSFILFSTDDSKTTISIKEVEHDLKEGLKTSEFAEMTIESKDETIKIDSFEITLARGNRAISISTINGNTFDLQKYKSHARPGDRIVIEIKQSRKTGLPESSKTVFTIRVE